MANKFDLQIAASEKRIEKFQKSVQMYEARLQKAIKVINKAGVYVTADDMVNTGNPKSRYAEFKFNNQSNLVKMVCYDFVCSACNAADYKYQNEHDLQKEIGHLAELKGQRDAMESKKEENATLRDALANALSEYKEEWLERMAKSTNCVLPAMQRARSWRWRYTKTGCPLNLPTSTFWVANIRFAH